MQTYLVKTRRVQPREALGSHERERGIEMDMKILLLFL
jgi:hypothetical protein